MFTLEPHHTGNRLLDRLATRDIERLAPRMERQKVLLRETLHRPQEPLRYAYFPVSNVLSSIVVLHDGSAVEAAAIGNEGLAGTDLLVGERVSPYLLVQQVEGESWRVPAGHFRSVLIESRPLRDLVERYALFLLRQCAQNAACNARHGADQRLARWVLVCADRAERCEFDITQDYLGIMLGISRQSVSTVIQSLQQQELIHYRRRHLTILNRDGLEQAACECYSVATRAYEVLFDSGAGCVGST